MFKTLVCYQLIDPGSEWRLHRHWYGHSAMADLLDSPMDLVAGDTLRTSHNAYYVKLVSLFRERRYRRADIARA